MEYTRSQKRNYRRSKRRAQLRQNELPKRCQSHCMTSLSSLHDEVVRQMHVKYYQKGPLSEFEVNDSRVIYCPHHQLNKEQHMLTVRYIRNPRDVDVVIYYQDGERLSCMYL